MPQKVHPQGLTHSFIPSLTDANSAGPLAAQDLTSLLPPGVPDFLREVQIKSPGSVQLTTHDRGTQRCGSVKAWEALMQLRVRAGFPEEVPSWLSLATSVFPGGTLPGQGPGGPPAWGSLPRLPPPPGAAWFAGIPNFAASCSPPCPLPSKAL